MKEVTIKLYSVDELTEVAKGKAYENWLACETEHFWGGEVRDTLSAIERAFSIGVLNWEYDSWSHNHGTIHWNDGRWSDGARELAGNRARSYCWNNWGDLLLVPKCSYYRRVKDGGFEECVSIKSVKYTSKMSSSRVYYGTCPLTGVCFDNDALDPMACFCFGVEWDEKLKKRVPWNGRTIREDNRVTVESIIRDCVDSLFKAASDDLKSQRSIESFEEYCMSNKCLFRECGEMWYA